MALAPIALASKSNKTRYGYEGAARLVNCYAEATGEEAKNVFAIYGTEGLDVWLTPVPAGRVWGVFATEDTLYGVTGKTVWSIDGADAVTIIGDLDAEGPVYFARNRRDPDTQIGLVSAADKKYWYIDGGTLTLNTDADLAGPPQCIDFQDGYFLIPTNFARYFITGEDNAATIGPTDFGKAQRSPGDIIRVISGEDEIILFKREATEWHTNNPSTTATFPYVPVASRNFGLLSARAACRINGTVYFLCNDGSFKRLSGYSAETVSTPDVDRAVAAVSDPDSIFAYAWNSPLGRTFIALCSDEWTWVYNEGEGWHERQSYNLPFWRVSAVAEWKNKVIAGDRADGRLYQMRANTFDEAGVPIVMTVCTPPVDAFPKPVEFNELYLDCIPAQGPAIEAVPRVMMSYSDDGGRTWSTERTADVGRRGNSNARARWNRLGIMRRNGRTFKFSMSANAARGLQSCVADVTRLG